MLAAVITALSLLPDGSALSKRGCVTRRAAALGGLFTSLASPAQPSYAFDNGVPEMALYKMQKKIPGTTTPTKVGLQSDGKLATCDYAPNCFSTSGDEQHLLEVWRPKAADAMDELLATVKSYPPGQTGIDGGGWRIVSSTPSYLYVQFESLKSVCTQDRSLKKAIASRS